MDSSGAAHRHIASDDADGEEQRCRSGEGDRIEPEREIEKQLRAYAKERREQAGAPIELHPATRKLLQGEAARP